MDKIIIGDISWLRNDYRQYITIGGITYPTLEHAYQASKTKDRAIRQQISDTDGVREARKIGRTITQSEIFDREKTMEALLHQKFADENLGLQLAQTGSAPIVMEGYDDFWGIGEFGAGQNMMGEILQNIRSELQIVYDIDLEDDCDGCDDCNGCSHTEPVPLLKDAIINAPDVELANLCQELFESAKGVIPFLDQNDFNAEHIAQKTGAPVEQIRAMILHVQKFQEVLTKLDDLLETPSEEDEADDEVEDDDADDSSVID